MNATVFEEPLPQLFRELQGLLGLRPPSDEDFIWLTGDCVSLKMCGDTEAVATRGNVRATIRCLEDGVVIMSAMSPGPLHFFDMTLYPESDSDVSLVIDGELVDENSYLPEIQKLVGSAH